MRSIRFLMPLALCAGLASAAHAQTATQTLNFNGGTGFSGSIGGNITATVKSQTTDGSVQTQGVLDITDLDIHWTKGGGFINLFPSSGSANNRTASTTINIAPSVVNIAIPTTAFSSPVTGSIDVTAGDNLANGVVGVLDSGVPGSDGRWDDPGQTGILNGATADNFNVTLSNPINATANVTGGLSATLPGNVVIPNVVDTTVIDVDLVLKQSTNVQVNFQPVQSLSINNLSISAATPVSLVNPLAGNFSEGAHPVPGANLMLDLSAGGVDLVQTTISGQLVADLMGTISGSVDLRADIEVIGLIDIPIDIDDVIDGQISDGVVSLIDLDENIALPGTELPFSISILHEATTDVDFDDVIAALQSGTFGLTLPIELLEEDVVLDLPATSFQEGGYSFPVSGTGYSGTVYLDNLEATLGGQVVLDLEANLGISANLFATALGQNAINVVPEPGSVLLMAMAGVGLVGIGLRRRRK